MTEPQERRDQRPCVCVSVLPGLDCVWYWHCWLIPRLGGQMGAERTRWPLGFSSCPDTFTGEVTDEQSHKQTQY